MPLACGLPHDLRPAQDDLLQCLPLAGVLSGKTLNSNQIEFVDLIVNHLTEHGVMDASLLYESPFTDLTPHGPDGLFTSTQVDELMSVLARVKSAALAA